MNLVKIQSSTATREPLPQFLVGLAPESLLDLSWTDPALGVQNIAWWPEDDQSQPLSALEKYGVETLTPDSKRKVVVVNRVIEPLSQEEQDAVNAQQAEIARADRDARLAASDWTQGKDIPDAISTKWATYRQALRDVPQQAGFPGNITWPEKPE